VTQRVNQPRPRRKYHAPRRTAAAAETRQAILQAAQEDFEARGWAATTVRSIAKGAGVSPKTVEALFTTKAALLEATLLAAVSHPAATADDPAAHAIIRPEAALEVQDEAALEIEAAPDAATMLDLHSALVCVLHTRAALLGWAVETAVPSDDRLAELWVRISESHRFLIRWSAEVLLQKPGIRADLTRAEAEETFVIALDWSTYRTLTIKRELTDEAVEAWIRRYYRRMLLA
jgi:AcrR family transcriptional regulator